ncbi:MAG TPA: 50S ribosomal protein L17 [Bacteroidetes bacterium]|nr:50S ribosomal protein L17 [Bacteroidota bacterium]
MIHGRAGRKLQRTASHRKALLNSLSTSLLRHKRIQTTLAKAKETRMFVEKLITRAKNAVSKEVEGGPKNIHARREVARHINDKEVVQMLFNEIAPKVATRPGGYTRVIKLGQRLGDGAHVAMIELVDFALNAETVETPVKKKQDRRTRINQKKKAKPESATEKVETTSAETK